MAARAGDPGSPACGDATRLAALAPYDILDTPREAEYDDLVQLAAQCCEAPVAVITFVLDDRQWFKAELGLGIRETSLDVSICRHLLLSPGLTVIPDTRADLRLACNPLVAAEPGLRFYAGCLLESREGVPLGTLCVLDREPRPGLEPAQSFALQALARQLISQLELRRFVREQQRLIEHKDLLFDELNHRVKNSLQLTAALIQLQCSAAHDERARAQLTETRRRVLTVAEFHERLYRSSDVHTVELGVYLDSLLETVAQSAPAGTEVRVEGGPATVATDSAVPVALIVNELVTNALKYAHPGGRPARIGVLLEAEGGAATAVTVVDDGVGLPPGFSPRSCASLGMRIVTGLLRQLGGSLGWSEAGVGARFRLELPRPLADRAG